MTFSKTTTSVISSKVIRGIEGKIRLDNFSGEHVAELY
jgi:hypothetical protein